jgi:hypothetical protein
MYFFDWTYQKSILALAITLPCFLFAQNNLDKEYSDNIEKSVSIGQEEHRVSITNLSDFNFGAFYPGKFGGSIEINKDGLRSSTGSVILLNSESNASAAVFEIKCPSNTLIHLVINSRIELRGESGETIICELLIPEQPHFVSPNNAETGFLYRVGAKLNIQDASFESTGRYFGRITVFIVLE